MPLGAGGRLAAPVPALLGRQAQCRGIGRTGQAEQALWGGGMTPPRRKVPSGPLGNRGGHRRGAASHGKQRDGGTVCKGGHGG